MMGGTPFVCPAYIVDMMDMGIEPKIGSQLAWPYFEPNQDCAFAIFGYNIPKERNQVFVVYQCLSTENNVKQFSWPWRYQT